MKSQRKAEAKAPKEPKAPKKAKKPSPSGFFFISHEK